MFEEITTPFLLHRLEDEALYVVRSGITPDRPAYHIGINRYSDTNNWTHPMWALPRREVGVDALFAVLTLVGNGVRLTSGATVYAAKLTGREIRTVLEGGGT